MKQTLDDIAEFYIARGYSGVKLRQILEKDPDYQKLVMGRKDKLKASFKTTKTESKKYVLSVERDFDILNRCKMLEKSKLAKNDRELVKLIKTQLEEDWRKPLINQLKRLEKKYK